MINSRQRYAADVGSIYPILVALAVFEDAISICGSINGERMSFFCYMSALYAIKTFLKKVFKHIRQISDPVHPSWKLAERLGRSGWITWANILALILKTMIGVHITVLIFHGIKANSTVLLLCLMEAGEVQSLRAVFIGE